MIVEPRQERAKIDYFGNAFVGYPNPAPINGPFILSGDIDADLFADYRVVTSNYQVLIKLDSLKTGFALQYSSKFTIGEIYRVYYQVYSNDKIFRGHGDFKFVNK